MRVICYIAEMCFCICILWSCFFNGESQKSTVENNKADTNVIIPNTVQSSIYSEIDYAKITEYSFCSASDLLLYLNENNNKFCIAKSNIRNTLYLGTYKKESKKIICIDSVYKKQIIFNVLDRSRIKLSSSAKELVQGEIYYFRYSKNNDYLIEQQHWSNGKRNGIWIKRDKNGESTSLYENDKLKSTVFRTWEEINTIRPRGVVVIEESIGNSIIE